MRLWLSIVHYASEVFSALEYGAPPTEFDGVDKICDTRREFGGARSRSRC